MLLRASRRVRELTSKFFKKGNQSLCNRSCRYCLVKQPTYDMKAVIRRTSPGNIVPCRAKLKTKQRYQ